MKFTHSIAKHWKSLQFQLNWMHIAQFLYHFPVSLKNIYPCNFRFVVVFIWRKCTFNLYLELPFQLKWTHHIYMKTFPLIVNQKCIIFINVYYQCSLILQDRLNTSISISVAIIILDFFFLICLSISTMVWNAMHWFCYNKQL